VPPGPHKDGKGLKSKPHVCPPLLPHGDGGIRERRVSFKKFPAPRCCLPFFTRTWSFTIPAIQRVVRGPVQGFGKLRPLLEIPFPPPLIPRYATPEGDFQITIQPCEPVRLGFDWNRPSGRPGLWPYFEGKMRLERTPFPSVRLLRGSTCARRAIRKSNRRIQEWRRFFRTWFRNLSGAPPHSKPPWRGRDRNRLADP